MSKTLLALAILPLAATAMPAAAQGTYVAVTQQYRPAPPPPYIPYQPIPQQNPYIPYAPVPLDVNVFDGFRVEAQVGWDHLGPADEDGIDGVSYGGEVGYDLALGSSAILGIYGGAEGSTGKECDTFTANIRVCFKSGRTFTAGGRIGFLVSPRTLVYAKGGYTNGQLRVDATFPVVPAFDVHEHQNLDGFHVGGGLETAFGRNAYGKIEYVYTRLSGLDVYDSDSGDFDRRKVDRHQVKAGVGLRM